VRPGEVPLVRAAETGVAYPAVDVVASTDAKGRVFVCVVNKSERDTALLSFRAEGMTAKGNGTADLWILRADPGLANTAENPERLQPSRRRLAVANGRFAARFAPLSVTGITITAAAPAPQPPRRGTP
jgi:alpha-L-arabinofuranosidase